ncbi:ABC transporter permease [Amycolatopsis pithecellobii]|uniref:ABC transporter permease subunit n=1 Tax=Amycolatopsis pithecellobii TaxID=664692 RepID=A0A6N7Z0U5_9PSEU|nr:ABC transporter permease [Amycolatopsis pithecellobii]MTD53230.1 ABC transporter permease subunit [Amycolatopsis pithecellobii]
MTGTEVVTTNPAQLDDAPPVPRQGYRRAFVIATRIILVAAAIGAWQLICTTKLVNPLFVPSPGATVQAFVNGIHDGSLRAASLETLKAAMIGFCIGMAAGTISGLVIGLSQTATKVLNPLVTVINSMPRIALAPLFVLWFGTGTNSAIALVVSLVFFIALTNVITGAQATERNQLTLAKLCGASRWQTIYWVVLPATVPWIIAAARLSLAYGLSAAIVSEMFLGQVGLGYVIVSGSGFFQMPNVFAAIIATVIIAGVLDQIASLAERRFLRWRPAHH